MNYEETWPSGACVSGPVFHTLSVVTDVGVLQTVEGGIRILRDPFDSCLADVVGALILCGINGSHS